MHQPYNAHKRCESEANLLKEEYELNVPQSNVYFPSQYRVMGFKIKTIANNANVSNTAIAPC